MTKYYYKTVVFSPKSWTSFNIPTDDMELELNRLGQLGWEVVSSTFSPNTNQLVVILKNNDANLTEGK